jgi:hypothetical protein
MDVFHKRDIDGLNQNFDIFIIDDDDVCIEVYYSWVIIALVYIHMVWFGR